MGWDVVVVRRLLPHLGDWPPLVDVVEQIENAVGVVGAEHHIDPVGPCPHQVLVLLGGAPSNGDAHAWAALLCRFQQTEVAVQLLVGVVADRARVENDQIGVLGAIDPGHTVGVEEPGDPLRIVVVHLAAEGAYEIGGTHPAGAPPYRRHVEHCRFGHAAHGRRSDRLPRHQLCCVSRSCRLRRRAARAPLNIASLVSLNGRNPWP